MSVYRDHAGNVISEDEWTRRSGDAPYVHVACTIVRDGRRRRVVKTVWVGFNPMQSFDYAASPPKIYATAMRRGSSEAFEHVFTIDKAAARERHDAAVVELAAELDNPTIEHLDAQAAFTV